MPEKIPRLVANVDVRKFKLDPMDGFLLTRIDGKLGMKDLARETGLPEFSVERALEKLEKMGVIERYDPSAPAVTPPVSPDAAPRAPQLPQFASLSDEQRYDPKELEEEVDIVPEQRKRILDVYYRLDDLDHYALLGVSKEADKKTVKRAYFELAAIFHPDRYYKKNLGTFIAKMEVLFTRVTEAHDTLVDAAKRLDYDAYLSEVATTRGMEALFERALAESKNAAPVPAPHVSTVPPAPVVPQGPTPEEIRARKEALAKRLLGGNSIRPEQKSKPPSEAPNPLRYSSTSDAMDALKRRYEQRIEYATTQQAKKYIDAAEDALSKNDIVAAASALGIAVKFTPDDVGLAMRYQEIKNKADAMMCDSYAKQAAYEEKQGHWQDAARSWQKVAKIRVTDQRAHERAANALWRMDDGDLHAAAEHAKQAITLSPQTLENHITLVEVYLKAGLTASARRAAEAAQQIDAKNPALVAAMKRIKG